MKRKKFRKTWWRERGGGGREKEERRRRKFSCQNLEREIRLNNEIFWPQNI
jgi:hypothetical protein